MKMLVKYFTIKILRILTRLICIFIPIRHNQILAYSFAGKQFSDSPKYVTDFIMEKCPDNFIVFWAVNNPEEFQNMESNYLRFIRYKSLKFAFEYMRSKFIITNMGPIRAIARRNSQEVINTWHGGGAYKKAGTETQYRNKLQIAYSRMAMADVTLFLSSSAAFTRVCIHDAYHYNGDILNSGLPRNDILFKKEVHLEIKEKVHEYFGLELDTKTVLYAPTWRNYDTSNYENIDFKSMLNGLKKKFGGRWVILYRAHNLMRNGSSNTSQNDIANATKYPDMQELMIATDILITDYSSCIWDYSFLCKPGFLYVPDLSFYEKQFGLCSPISQWGFKVCTSNEELKSAIFNYVHENQLEAIIENHALFESYETGEASRRVYNYIISKV